MPGFIDIHSHILPNVDDGSKSLEQSLNMLKIAYEEGIRIIIATPHYKVDRCECSYEKVKDSYNLLSEAMKKDYPDMEIYLGNELMNTEEVENLYKKGNIMTLAKSDYILVEFYPSVSVRELHEMVNSILLMGKIPVIAHVERYACLLEDIEQIYELKEYGAVIQVNTGSVNSKKGGRTVKKFLKKIFKENLVDIIATDAHSDGHRAPYMKDAARYISKKYGEDYSRLLTMENPEKILKNLSIN